MSEIRVLADWGTVKLPEAQSNDAYRVLIFGFVGGSMNVTRKPCGRIAAILEREVVELVGAIGPSWPRHFENAGTPHRAASRAYSDGSGSANTFPISVALPQRAHFLLLAEAHGQSTERRFHEQRADIGVPSGCQNVVAIMC